jgi:hypothetical protein
MTVLRRSLLVLAVALAAVGAGIPSAHAGQGSGNPRLTVSSSSLPAGSASLLTVTGTDYLVPPHAAGTDVFGGVYLFFGWVADAGRFGPSIRNSNNNDGTAGVTYAYPGEVGDASQRDDGSGNMRLVSFTAGGESGNATDFHMDDAGNWSATLRVPGAVFHTTNPITGEVRSFDCTEVQCGVFTIGAHGKASATNEKFTPLTFTGSPPGTSSGSGSGGGGAAGPAPDGDSSSGQGGGSGTGASGSSAPGASSESGDATGEVADPDTALSDGPQVVEADPADASDAAPEDERALVAAQVSSTRRTGGLGAPLLVGIAAVVVGAVGGGVWWRRHLHRAATDHRSPGS